MFIGVSYLLNLMDHIIKFIIQAVQLLELQHSLILGLTIHIKNQLFNIIIVKLNVRMYMVQINCGFTAVYLK